MCDILTYIYYPGVITYLLLSGESPFGGCGGPEPLMQVRDNILKGSFVFEPEDIWENVSSKAMEFIKRLLVTDPHLRPTAREVQKDLWLLEMAERLKNKDESHSSLNPSVVKALVNFKEYSDMRKLLCEVLSFTLIPDQIQGLRKEFEKMDTDGSGEISLSALKTVLLGNAAQGSLGALKEEEVEDIFNAMRVNKTETTIHWHEFIAAGLSHCKVDERNLKLAFDRLDADHTGYITFENFMDLIGNGDGHSEEELRAMWGEASENSSDAFITYEDFLLLMKGQGAKPTHPKQKRPTPTAPMTPMLDKLGSLQTVAEGTEKLKSSFTSVHSSNRPSTPGGFMSPSYDDNEGEGEHSDGPICIDDDDGDDGIINQGFSEAMKHQENGTAIVGSLAPLKKAGSPPGSARKPRAKSFDSDESHPSPPVSVFTKNSFRAVNLPESTGTDDKVNTLLEDKSKTPLVVNRELYRAHRSMRLAVVEASKRLEEEQQRRAREEIRKEQAQANKGAGLIMRHGGELSADAIKQFVMQQQKEEQKKVQEASKRAGRRHARNRTSSDIRGMFGGSDSDISNLTNPPKRNPTAVGGIPDFTSPPSPLNRGGRHPLSSSITSSTKGSPKISQNIAPDLPELPLVRKREPGQFRKTNYDPFSFGVKKQEGPEKSELLRDTSLHRHLDLGLVKPTSSSSKPNSSLRRSEGHATGSATSLPSSGSSEGNLVSKFDEQKKKQDRSTVL